ncbi:cilia- and flagella-associated protein 119 isoform X3 [Mobula birostris]|uniref:cilia- and flagella-associated protein 119 isoform X3 n=1 Tax=Mobula birostris TaxID=1983395 RepID=UPI003B27DC2C
MVMEESDSGPSEQISDQFSYTRLSTSSAGVQMDYKRLEKPPLPEARICIWEDLTYSGMDVIEQAASMEELKLNSSGERERVLPVLQGAASLPRCAATSVQHRSIQCRAGEAYHRVRHRHLLQTLQTLQVRLHPSDSDGPQRYILGNARNTSSLCFLSRAAAAEEEELVLEEQQEKDREELEVHAQEEDPQATGIRGDDLREYIEARVAERVSELRVSLEGQLKASERQLGAQLSALERPGFREGQKASRGKR